MSGSVASFPDITSERLRLVWMTPGFMRASLAGRRQEAEALAGAILPDWWPDGNGARIISIRLEQMEREPESAEWLLRLMVDIRTSRVVGYVNFHSPPIDGRAELGYTVFEPFRRQGYASEAARAMLRWANQVHGVAAFVVSISPGNEPSLGLAAKLGFERVGTQYDDVDGEEWVFELAWPPAKA
jgi:RimJ/RimL family protein N-acetyltransferase